MSDVVRIAKRGVFAAAILSTAAAPAFAQVEASIVGGYTVSEGIEASESRPLLGQIYNSLDLKSGGSFGFTVGFFIGPNYEVEFLWSRQFSQLEASDPAPVRKLANQDIDNYHGNLVYNFGAPDAKVRPYVFGGLGATHYTPGDYDPSIPNSSAISNIASFTRFSTTWGAGVKAYATPAVGIKAGVRWTPTYIKSDAAGLWCDPFYPTCWVVGDADYANQFEFSGGVTFRFGGR